MWICGIWPFAGSGLAAVPGLHRHETLPALAADRFCRQGSLDSESSSIRAGAVLAYAHKTASTSDPGYQQLQARIALGSGGMFGAGLMESKQKMMYLPEAHNDFIYAVVGEETGFLGATALLSGFVMSCGEVCGWRCGLTTILAAIWR